MTLVSRDMLRILSSYTKSLLLNLLYLIIQFTGKFKYWMSSNFFFIPYPDHISATESHKHEHFQDFFGLTKGQLQLKDKDESSDTVGLVSQLYYVFYIEQQFINEILWTSYQIHLNSRIFKKKFITGVGSSLYVSPLLPGI